MMTSASTTFAITGPDGSQSLSLAGQPVSLGSGGALSVHLTAPTSASSFGVSYDNPATVSTTNVVSVVARPPPRSTLFPYTTLFRSADAPSVSAGSPIGFSVSITNTGAGTATGVTLTDALPGGNVATPVHRSEERRVGNSAITGPDRTTHLNLNGPPVTPTSGGAPNPH